MSSSTDIYTVYKILNLVNSKVYIGITTRDPEKRWNEHIRRYKYRTCALYLAMNKHGIENFLFSIIEQTFALNELLELETRYIKEYNSYVTGYNMTLGGEGTSGLNVPHTIETRKKISESLSGRALSESHKLRIANSLAGKKNHMKGKCHSVNTKNKMSKAKSGKSNPRFGKEVSLETRKKISESLKKRTQIQKSALAGT